MVFENKLNVAILLPLTNHALKTSKVLPSNIRNVVFVIETMSAATTTPSFWEKGHMLAGSSGNRLFVWNPHLSAQRPEQWIDRNASTTSICWSSNRNVLASAGSDGRVTLYQHGPGGAVLGTLPGDGSDVRMGHITCVRFAKDNTLLYVASKNGKVYEWDMKSQGQVRQSFHCSSACVLDWLNS